MLTKDESREAFVAPARRPLTQALCQAPGAKLQKILRVVAEVDGTIKLSGDLQGLIPVYDAFSGANATERRASEQRAWESLLNTCDQAADAGVHKYNKRVLPVMNFAERRDVASLCTSVSEVMRRSPFRDLLGEEGALPCWYKDGDESARVWRWNRNISRTSVNEELAHLELDLKSKLLVQWSNFYTAQTRAVQADISTHLIITDADAAIPANFWIRTRHAWCDLSELMLYWLTTPISTACIERGFSFMTIMDSNTRRRRMGESLFRVEMLCHLHKPWLDNRLTQLVQETSSGGARACAASRRQRQACAQADSEASISDLSSASDDLEHEGPRNSAKLPKSQTEKKVKKPRQRIPALAGPLDWGEKKQAVSAVIRIN